MFACLARKFLPVRLYRRLDRQNQKANDYAMGGALAGLAFSERTGVASGTKHGVSVIKTGSGAATGLVGAERVARVWQNRH